MPYGRSKKKPLMSKEDLQPRRPPPVDGEDEIDALYAKGIAEIKGDKPPVKYGSRPYGSGSSGYGS
jgi:hypothetical protein